MKRKIILLSAIFSIFITNSSIIYATNNEVNQINSSYSQHYNDEIPIYSATDFFKISESLAYTLSEDGEYLYYVEEWKGKLNVFKKNIKTNVSELMTKITNGNLLTYLVKGETILYMKDFGGDENYHIFKMDEYGNEVDLTPYENTRVVVMDLLNTVDSKNEILIQMNLDNKELFSVYRLNVLDAKIEKIIDNTVGYTGFISDSYGQIRIAAFADGVNSGYYYRETEKDEFKLIQTYDFHEEISIIAFTEDNKTAYALSNIGRDKTALINVDVATGKELKVIAENDKVDISGMGYGKKVGSLGTVYYITDKINFEFFDSELENLYKEAQKALDTTENIGVSPTKNFKKAIISTSSDTNRGISYLFDRTEGTIEKLSDTNTVDTNHLAEMKPIEYTSRDGYVINGYLTLPKNKEAKNLPVIINPHGGPWTRDIFGYNPEVQFLANRGYAVLQMNFRGSTGYGKEFLEAGYKQWGGNMQNDITDAVEWVISTGVANPEKIGIYGASYGGYATLAGIAFTPDLYAAAVDYVGVSNLFTFLETIPPYWESMREMLYEMVGNPETDSDMFIERSPVFHADKIKTPLFIAQGVNDPRVRKAESDQMVAALEANGSEVKYMVRENEGHGFSQIENQIDFYTEMEIFFAKYLGGSVFEQK
jgi:dipeptidyl aminopeptidase/acylaminoacyl peptidase